MIHVNGNNTNCGQPSNLTTWLAAMISLALRGINGVVGPAFADTLRRDLHNDLKTDDDMLVNPPINHSNWLRSDEIVLWKYELRPKGSRTSHWCSTSSMTSQLNSIRPNNAKTSTPLRSPHHNGRRRQSI
jgi:type I restriction-modification system DNA methylase subunit